MSVSKLELTRTGPLFLNILTEDNVRLRTACYTPISRRKLGTVCIFQGRSEFIEKYAETIADLRRRGFAVVAFDWRGQGGSERLLSDFEKCHIDDFNLFLKDIEAVFQDVMEIYAPKPWFCLAHSMGSTILLKALQAGEKRFERVVLASPMVQITVLTMPSLVKFTAFTLDYIGMGGCYVPGAGRVPVGSKPFSGNLLTSDPVRYAQIGELLQASPHLALGDPTIGWIAAAFRVMDELASPDFGIYFSTPSLVMIGGADKLCSSRAALNLAAHIPRCKGIEIIGAKHELLIERDPVRQQFWSAFDAFIPGEQKNICVDTNI